MKYSVSWTRFAERQLAALWLAAANRQAVTEAAHEIDQRLERNPSTAGEARSGTTRVLFEPPLAVYFDVIEDDRSVEVLQVLEVSSQ